MATLKYPTSGPIVELRYTRDGTGRLDKVERKLSTDVEGISSTAWEDCAVFEYEGSREIERTQAPYDLERTQSWTAYREPEILRYEKDSTNALRTGLSSYWDADGRMVVRKRLHDTASYDWGEVFRYDGMDRLTKMWRDVQDPHNFTSTDPTDTSATFDDRVTYTLGKVYERDNVKVKPDGGSETTTEYTDNDFYQYTQVGSTNWAWDGNGQLSDEGPWAYQWTGLGQLHKATPDTGTAREYTYDAFGRRVSTKVGSQVNEYVYHSWHMVGEWDDTAGKWLWQEVPFPEGEGMLEHIALDTNDLDNDANTTEYRPYAAHEDFQSTVWGLSDSAGAIVERYRYREPYGDTYTEDATGTDIGDFASEVYHVKRLHGGVVDGVFQRYDFRNRWLRSLVGGWLSRDPLGNVDSANLYQAFLAAPMDGVDPFGADHGTILDRPEQQDGCTDCGCPAKDNTNEDWQGYCAGLESNYEKNGKNKAYSTAEKRYLTRAINACKSMTYGGCKSQEECEKATAQSATSGGQVCGYTDQKGAWFACCGKDETGKPINGPPPGCDCIATAKHEWSHNACKAIATSSGGTPPGCLDSNTNHDKCAQAIIDFINWPNFPGKRENFNKCIESYLKK